MVIHVNVYLVLQVICVKINIDDCATQPCRRGQCIDKINGFICSCYSGSDGVLCDVS